jgi:c-di-GMP-related signal transduction protein
MVMEYVVARQPVIGLDDRIVGFRLLRRPTAEAGPAGVRAEEPLSLPALLGDPSLVVDGFAGDPLLLCPPWSSLLGGDDPIDPAVRRATLEIPAELSGDVEYVERCRELTRHGYALAVELCEWHPGLETLLGLASVVEIDLSGTPREQALDLVARCRPYGVTLMATRCRTDDDLAWATASGFELLQGPAVQRPPVIRRAALAPSALGQVQLASELLDEEVDFARVEEILEHEPALVVQVLHEASLGAGGGLRRQVLSVREALVVLGTRRLRQWAALAVLGRSAGSNRNDALIVALVRARMCALLAGPHGIDPGYAFTAGLLSALDRLLGIPIDEIGRNVDVDVELGAAAFQRSGPVGALVGAAADYQVALDAGDPIPPGDVDPVAARAFAWALPLITAIDRASVLA